MQSRPAGRVGGQWSCPLCRQLFSGKMARSNHEQNTLKLHTDPTRCDNLLASIANSDGDSSGTLQPESSGSDSDSSSGIDSDSSSGSKSDYDASDFQHVRHFDPRPSRRPRGDTCPHFYDEAPAPMLGQVARAVTNFRDMVPVQLSWREHLNTVSSLFSPEFWKKNLPLHTQSTTAIDAALGAAKKVFIPCTPHSKFPTTKRSLLNRIKQQTMFWTQVTHTAMIDLTPCGVAQTLRFRFVDPIWGWIMAARRLSPSEMKWRAMIQTLRHSGDRVYGAGVQYGTTFQEACRSCPVGTYPMPFTLHWDGTQAYGQDTSPIVIGVVNVNGQSVSAQTCIAHLPKPHGMGSHWHSSAVEVKFYIRQQCIAAILEVGVECVSLC